MSRKLATAIALVGIAAMVGCAEPPTNEVSAAKSALDAARKAEATEYAPDALHSAESAVQRLDAELKLQEEKFALFRDYEQATKLATDAKSEADKAATAASQEKERMRTETTAMVAELRTLLEDAKALLAAAPAGKGSQADIEVLKSDLARVEAVIPEIESVVASGKYKEAKAKAEAAKQSIESVRTAVMEAMEAREAGRKRA